MPKPVVTAPAPAPAPEPAPAPAPEVSAKEWEGRYSSMKGRYDKADQIMKQQAHQLQTLSGQVMALQNELKQKAQAPVAPAQQLTDDEVQAFGPEFINVSKKAALDAVSPVINAQQQEIQQLKQENAKNSAQYLYATLAREVPNWEQINQHPSWLGWLRLPDIYSGVIRQRLLDEAWQAADAPRVVSFFQGFLREVAATTPAKPQESQPAQVTKPRQAAAKLEDFAAPGRARSTPTPPAVEKPTITRAFIDKFYADSRRGYYTGRKAEYDRIQNEIFAAQREGRIQ
jgi:hypothetical protein